MSLVTIKNEVLEYLFSEYANNSDTAIYTINEIVKKHGGDSNEIGRYLLDNGWVKNQNFGPFGFGCSITLSGIQEIRPAYVTENVTKIISTLGLLGDRQSLMEVLDLPKLKHQTARDIANYVKDLGYIEVNYALNDAMISLTLKGRDYYNTNKSEFLP